MINREHEHWKGLTNRLIRYYYYCQRGLALFNEMRYVILVIFGIYVAMKLTNPLWMVLMFIVCVPILIIAGWISVFKLGKVIDWLNIEFSSHFSRYGYELQEKILKNLEEINEKLNH